MVAIDLMNPGVIGDSNADLTPIVAPVSGRSDDSAPQLLSVNRTGDVCIDNDGDLQPLIAGPTLVRPMIVRPIAVWLIAVWPIAVRPIAVRGI